MSIKIGRKRRIENRFLQILGALYLMAFVMALLYILIGEL